MVQGVRGGVDRLLHHRHRGGRHGGGLARELQRLAHGVTRLRDLLDQAPVQRLLRRHALAQQHDALGPRRPDEGDEARQRTPLQVEADLHLGHVEVGVAREHAPVAGERDGDAGADREAVHRRDRHLRHLLPGLAQAHAAVEAVAQGGIACEGLPGGAVLQVDAGGERVWRAREHDHPRLEVLVERARHVGEFEDRRLVEGIEAAAAVEAHDGDRSLAFDGDVLVGHRAGSSGGTNRHAGTACRVAAIGRRFQQLLPRPQRAAAGAAAASTASRIAAGAAPCAGRL